MTSAERRYAFFLGGRDLEMVEIASLLACRQQDGDHRIAAIHDLSLSWGAKASDHGEAIWVAHREGQVPVLVELIEDMPLPNISISIDHHGDRSGEPSALAQVFTLLDLPSSAWTRRLALVDANDRGHIEAMRAIGASIEEMVAIRADDRHAQGISRDEEESGQAAIANIRPELSGTLLVAHLSHDRTATVCDPLALSGETRDLLIFCRQSTQFFGSGERITRLDNAFPGGWRGGQLPLRGYWGISQRLTWDAVIACID